MQPPLLEIHEVAKTYGGGMMDQPVTTALADFSLTIPGDPPRITTIAGESGSGKTTLANLVLGLLTPTRGQIRYRGEDIQRMDKQSWFTYRREVQAIFQNPFEVYNPFYKVDHVFHFALRKFRLAADRASSLRLIEDALEVVGLRPSEILGRYPHQLSGGQRQRLMIARAFMLKPKLIIADEPVSMIDASLQARILDIFERLRSEFGISFLYITHDLSTAYQISDDIQILYLGQVMEKGNIDAVMHTPTHPYTQLLVSSIPTPDPDERWGQSVSLVAADGNGASAPRCDDDTRCQFYPQCTLGGDCERRVGWTQVGEDHWVVCAAPEQHRAPANVPTIEAVP